MIIKISWSFIIIISFFSLLKDKPTICITSNSVSSNELAAKIPIRQKRHSHEVFSLTDWPKSEQKQKCRNNRSSCTLLLTLYFSIESCITF